MNLQTTLGHILVVDDDDLVREFVITALQEYGYSAVGASNGLEAVMEIQQHAKPDVILLDLNMPGMDGREFLRLAREHTGRDFGVIVMTGERGPRLKESVMRFGALTLLEKPIDIEKLIKMVRIQREFQQTRNNLK